MEKGKGLQQNSLEKFKQPESRELEPFGSCSANPTARNGGLREKGEKECVRNEGNSKAGNSNGNGTVNKDSGTQSSADKHLNGASACLLPKSAASNTGSDNKDRNENDDKHKTECTELKRRNGSGINRTREEKSSTLLNIINELHKKNGVPIDLEQPAAKRPRTNERNENAGERTIAGFATSKPSARGGAPNVLVQTQSPIGVNSEAASILLPSAASTNGVLRERQENGAGERAIRPPEMNSISAEDYELMLFMHLEFIQCMLTTEFAEPIRVYQNELLYQAAENMLLYHANTGNGNGFAATVPLSSAVVTLAQQSTTTSIAANNSTMASAPGSSTDNIVPTAAMNTRSVPQQSAPSLPFSVDSLLNNTNPNAASFEDLVPS